MTTRAKDLLGRDSRNNYVYKRLPNHLVRFSDYHPRTNQEAFFYNILLAKIPFRDEAELFSEANKSDSYLVECMMRDDPAIKPPMAPRKIVQDMDDLEELVNTYCTNHMFRCEGRIRTFQLQASFNC